MDTNRTREGFGSPFSYTPIVTAVTIGVFDKKDRVWLYRERLSSVNRSEACLCQGA
jgi:hypothetical protein